MKDIYDKEIKCDGSGRNMVKIFIAESVPSLNKGEMTILEGMLESFKTLGKVEVTMLSDLPQIDQPRYGTKVKIIDAKKTLLLSGKLVGHHQLFKMFISFLFLFQHLLFSILYKISGSRALKLMKSEIWREYVESDVIIIGHNGTFGAGWGMLRTPVYFYYFYMPLFAKMMDKPIVLYGGCITRFRRFRRVLEKGAKFALNRVNLITLRENVSYRNLREMGVKNDKVFVTPDLAFLLHPVSSERAKEIMVREGIEESYRPLIGMTVTRNRTFMAFPDINPEKSYIKHNMLIAQVIDDITSRLNAFVVFVPHCIGFGDELDDRIEAKDIFQIVKNKNRVKVITNEYAADELKGLIGQFDLFIGERIHSVVNAMSMCVPSIIIDRFTDERLGIIKMIDQENAIYYVKGLDANTLILKIDEIWSEREKIKSELKSKIEIIQERAMLNGKLLKELLESWRV
ncbi:MAG: polysaccharide pyruvyl transferase family protein [Methanophagales archaeon]|nr:polysaccharide pyruvyl transferase family protein [Methanophagales archaeon]